MAGGSLESGLEDYLKGASELNDYMRHSPGAGHNGDENAVSTLYHSFVDLMLPSIRNRIRLFSLYGIDAEDVFHEAFLRFWNAKPAHDKNLVGYFWTIAKHLIIDFSRKAEKELLYVKRMSNPCYSDDESAQYSSEENISADMISAGTPASSLYPIDAHELLVQRGQMELVERLLTQDSHTLSSRYGISPSFFLKPHHQQVLKMRLDGAQYDEIARVLSISPGTVKSRIHHGISKMGDLVTRLYEE